MIVQEITKAGKSTDFDCVEAIGFGLDSAVLMTGKYVDKVPPNGTANCMGRWYKPWFFKHVETFLTKDPSKGPHIEYIPTKVRLVSNIYLHVQIFSIDFCFRTTFTDTTRVFSGSWLA